MHKFLTGTYNSFCALFKSCIDHTYVRMFINLLLMRRPCLPFVRISVPQLLLSLNFLLFMRRTHCYAAINPFLSINDKETGKK